MDPMRLLVFFVPVTLLVGVVAAESFRRASSWRRLVAAALATLGMSLWLTSAPPGISPSLPWAASLYVGFVTGALWEVFRSRS